MKTVTGRVINAEPISLSKAATILSRFVSSENGASQDVSAYLRRAAAAFTELKSFHRETKTRSNARSERNQADEFEELGRAKGIDDLVENGGKIRFRKSEAVREEESINGREQDEIKEEKKKKKKKKKSKKNKEEDVVDEKVKEKLEDEQRNEERKERKKKKSKKNKEEDVIDKKVNEKLEEQQRNEERQEKRKSDGETGSDERKSKKKKKSKEIDG